MARHGKITCNAPKRYWKIPEYWELSMELIPQRPVPPAFDDVMQACASNWEVHRFASAGSWAVWNARAPSVFMIPEVRWAHLEYLDRSNAAPGKSEGAC